MLWLCINSDADHDGRKDEQWGWLFFCRYIDTMHEDKATQTGGEVSLRYNASGNVVACQVLDFY